MQKQHFSSLRHGDLRLGSPPEPVIPEPGKTSSHVAVVTGKTEVETDQVVHSLRQRNDNGILQ